MREITYSGCSLEHEMRLPPPCNDWTLIMLLEGGSSRALSAARGGGCPRMPQMGSTELQTWEVTWRALLAAAPKEMEGSSTWLLLLEQICKTSAGN